ncbi:MAG TPA: bifunctional serine/threonine-protein kinase/formylglycine-generating enzyme family protein [Pyrinomonadaceae bacterium]|nr:bifunctional serine/threonine-protein kinase/formylglycine-generating enzyme family protein [Pyrinomonadaceae bacterium]
MKECPSCHRCFPDKLNHCPSDGDRLTFLIALDTILDERYQLERKLGQGGMGMVFKARHVFIKTQHAIKIILPDLVGNDPSLVARFRQEAMASAAIRHPNTVSVTDYGIIDGRLPYLVMEFVEGLSLHDILVSEKRLAPERAVEIMLAVCAGVSAAHRMGIVHRDLKPLNILLKPGLPPGEGLKVLDFGLAKIKSGELLGSFVAAQTQGMMGSPFYMAPEQWSDEEIDVRADVYSLGVILYQMLAGDVPFKGKSIPSIMNMHLNAAPVRLSERGIEVPAALEQAVQHALEKEPERRPQTVDDLIAELRAAVPGLNGDVGVVPGVGISTVQISPADLTGSHERRGAETGAHGQSTGAHGQTTGAQGEAPDHLKTIASTPDALGTHGVEGDAAHGRATIAGIPEARTDSLADSAPLSPDTARQQPAQTFENFDAGAHRSPAEALTEPLPSVADTHRQEAERAEALRRLQAEEQQRREAEERQRREAEERQRREAEESAALAAQQQSAASSAAQQANAFGQPGPHVSQVPGTPAPPRSRALLFVIGGMLVALFLLAGLGVAGYLFIKWRQQQPQPKPTPTATPSQTPKPTTTPATPPHAEPVSLPGGTFRVGRDDVPPVSDRYSRDYLTWLYSQWPAHDVSIKPFAIDRTEVTNAEYAEFVKETKHAPPPSVWDGDRPKPGEEQLPVSNISLDDARAFAEWRSRRDGVTYRLPTEEEWEYAARGGDPARLFPWGDRWEDGRANLGAASARPVGSFPQGNTPQGVADMIGNLWEWTSTEASLYKGNDRVKLGKGERGWFVIRGGSFESRPDGDKPITATVRNWVARSTRDTHLGFRLVRAEQED